MLNQRSKRHTSRRREDKFVKFAARVLPDPSTKCWNWIGGISRNYGYFMFGSRTQGTFDTTLAHRFSYVMFRDAIPAGLELDHLCRNTRCVNPNHLEPVTPKENVFRSNSFQGINARKTSCLRGHHLSGYNLIICNQGKSRRCRICKNSNSVLFRSRKKLHK